MKRVFISTYSKGTLLDGVLQDFEKIVNKYVSTNIFQGIEMKNGDIYGYSGGQLQNCTEQLYENYTLFFLNDNGDNKLPDWLKNKLNEGDARNSYLLYHLNNTSSAIINLFPNKLGGHHEANLNNPNIEWTAFARVVAILIDDNCNNKTDAIINTVFLSKTMLLSREREEGLRFLTSYMSEKPTSNSKCPDVFKDNGCCEEAFNGLKSAREDDYTQPLIELRDAFYETYYIRKN